MMKRSLSSHLRLVADDLALTNPTISSDEFIKFFSRCEVWNFEWGLIMAEKDDMHIHILSKYRKKVFLRKPLRMVANIMFDRYKTIKTSVLKPKLKSLEFNLKIGWKLINETPERWFLQMNKEDFKYGKG